MTRVQQDRCTLYIHDMAVKNITSCQKTKWEKATHREVKRYHEFLRFILDIGLNLKRLLRLVAYWGTSHDTP